ncbi:hypothetical protein ABT063_47275 [Streptomyces sp. NPDC002838]|uniref:hypothetical protein n=1 Tax=Streptomyces sp. NPDC002838 TaxID=3154436 RepID=UPI003325D05D
MQREPTPGPTESGLSTEDLAEPHGPDAGAEPESRPEASAYPGEATASEPAASPAQTEPETTAAADDQPQLLTTEDEEGFRARWQEIQNEFVDDPREAVHAADALVADVMQTLAATFAEHKQDLEKQWNRGEEANTEDLRMALHKYRSFFRRLLST